MSRLPLSPAVLLTARRIFIGVTLSFLFASFTLGGTRAARPVFGALALGCALCFYLLQRRAPISQAAIGRVFELVAFNVALTVVLSELSLRAFAAWSGRAAIISDALDAYHLTPGYDYPGGLHGNSLGFPGRDFHEAKEPGMFRIAALGDSFAVGPAVRSSENYLSLVEKSLSGTEVYNFGVSGTGPREYSLLLAQYGWTYHPDLVLVSIFVGNDITEIMATPRQMHPRGLALYLFVERSFRVLTEHWRRAEDRMGNEERKRSDERRPALSPQTFRETEARRLAVCFKSPPRALEKKWRRAERYLGDIIEQCRRKKVPVGFILIPDEFQVNPVVLREALECEHVERGSVDLQLPQRRLLRFFAERDVPCLDLLPEFAGVADAYAPNDTHWNTVGNQLAARRMVEWLNALRHKTMNYGGVALAK